MTDPIRSAVAMVVFSRPDTTARVLDAVRRARPPRLLVIGNAARPDVAGEDERCRQVRDLIEGVDWECDVSTNYAPEHLSMRKRFETGLDWLFSEVPEAIVLEDDCIPDPTFFPFCDALLDRYRDEDAVMSVGGSNVQFEGPPSGDSYFFSRYPAIWGWAGWTSSWEAYDPAMSDWPERRDDGWLEREFDDPHAVAYWKHLFEQTHGGDDAWDRAFLYAGLRDGRVHAIPGTNLVTNVGFREDATHTGPEQRGVLDDVPSVPMEFPLKHPAAIERNADADAVTAQRVFSGVFDQLFDRMRANVRAAGRGGE